MAKATDDRLKVIEEALLTLTRSQRKRLKTLQSQMSAMNQRIQGLEDRIAEMEESLDELTTAQAEDDTSTGPAVRGIA